MRTMNISLIASLLACACISLTSAFTCNKNAIPSSSLHSSLGDEIRDSQSIFDNISYTSRSSTTQNTIGHNSGYAPVSQSTGQVGNYGVIGETPERNVPIDYNSSKSSRPAFVPHSSTGAGNALMSNASPYRHAPTDYNACKSFSVSQDELGYFRGGTQQQFTPHSSTGAGDYKSAVSQSRYAPSDYNSSKSFASSTNEIVYYKHGSVNQSAADNVESSGHNKSIDLNSKAAPFVPHSSTGAGGGAMSANSPFYQNGRYQ